MPTLLIAYDLAQPAAAASMLADAIIGLGTHWARPLAGLWYVETERSPAEVEAQLSYLIEIDDGLLVQQVVGAAEMANTMLRWTAKRGAPHETAGRIITWPKQATKNNATIAEAA